MPHASCLIVCFCLAFCVAHTACSSPQEDSPPLATATIKQALEPDMMLGRGYEESRQHAKGAICIHNYREDLQLVDRRSMTAFQTYRKNEIENKVGASLEIDVDNGYISADLKTKLNEYYSSQSTTRAVLSVVVYVESVDRYLDKNGSGGGLPSDGSGNFSQYCNPAHLPSQLQTLEQFLTTCGDRYVSKHRLGGIITLTVDVSTLNREDRLDLEGKFKVGTKKLFTGDVDSSFTSFDSSSSEVQSLKFQVDAYGVPSPDPALLTNGKLTADNWLGYMQQVERGYQDAFDQWRRDPTSAHVYDSALGVPLEQEFALYDPYDMINCSKDGDGFGAAGRQFACYQDFWSRDTWAYSDHKFSELQTRIATIQWSLDNPTKVYWRTPIRGHQAEFQAALDQYNQCVQSRPDARDGCENARLGGQVGELCGMCQHQRGCRDEDLKKMLDELAEAPIKPADPKPLPPPKRTPPPSGPFPPANFYDPVLHSLTQNHDSSIGNPLTELCVWSGLSGRLDGGGEGAKVYINANNQWAMKTWSANNKYIRSSAICMPRQNFFGAVSNAWQSTHIDERNSTNSVTTHNLSYDADTLFALSGLSGKMEGDGEYAKLETVYPATPTQLKVATQQGTLRTWTHAFGLEDPSNNTVEFGNGDFKVDTSAGDLEARLSPSDSTLCYLKFVAGEFDGGSESVQIVNRDGHWYLTVTAIRHPLVTNPLKAVKAEAECIYFDQSF